MSNNSLRLSWNMTLKDYREYFNANEQYRKFCDACYQWSKSDPDSQANYLHLAFSVLFLEKCAITSEIWNLYSKDVMASKNAKGTVNAGAVNQGMNGIFALRKDGSPYEPWYNLLNQIDPDKTTILETYKIIKTGLSKDPQSFKNPQKISAALETVLDKLLTPTDTDIIRDRIENGGCRQIILTGAPGTGKTTIARDLAEALGSPLDGEKYTLVQFHPSYDYTDFVEGLRPVAQTSQENSNIQFAKMDGSFKAFCRKVAEENQSGLPKTSSEAATKLLHDVEENLKSLSKATAFMTNIEPLSKCFEILSSEEEDSVKKNAFKTAFGKIDLKLFQNSAPMFPREDLNASAEKLKICVMNLKKIMDNDTFFNTLFTLTALIQNKTVLAVCNPENKDTAKEFLEKPDENPSSGTASHADVVYQAFSKLRTDTSNLQKETFNEVFGKGDSFTKILSEIRNLTFLNPYQEPKDKTNWAIGRLSSICNVLEYAQVAYQSISAEFFEAYQVLTDWNYQEYHSNKALQISEALKALATPSRSNNENASGEPLYFFIIDEINRANLSKVFGELMYGLEKDKRDTGFQTQYHNLPTCDNTGEKIKNDIFDPNFYIPGNVMIIGTMNDIDRSVDSMDYALRRRFEWKEIVVDERSLSAAFTSGKYIQTVQDNQGNLVRCVMALNRYIQDNGDPYNLNRQYFISQGQFAHLPQNLTALDNLNVFDEKAVEDTGTTESTDTAATESASEAALTESESASEAALAELENLKKVLGYTWKYRIEPLLREYLRGESEKDIQKFIDGAHSTLKKTLHSIRTDIPNPKKSKSKGTA